MSLGDNYLDCSPFGEDSIFLSIPKTGDGIFTDVAAGMMLVFYVLYGVCCLFPYAIYCILFDFVYYILCIDYVVYTIYCALLMMYILYIV